MGEIRFVGTGETRGYPYPVCKNVFYRTLMYALLSNKSRRSFGGDIELRKID